MIKLVFAGHTNRGGEIIKLLEMLGGKNTIGFKNTFIGFYYWINENNEIVTSDMPPQNSMVYPLEDFEDEYPYKVGDLVRYFPHKVSVIKSMFISYDGDIKYGLEDVDDEFFQAHQLEYVGQAEYYQVNENVKSSKDINLQQLEKQLDEALEKETKESLEKFFFGEPQLKAPILSNRYDYAEGKCGYVIPNGYEFDYIKEGLQPEIILKPKKPQYPKYYEECCDILGRIYPITDDVEGYKWELILKLQRLIVCRDAYWKIAGEELGLGKPWEPDWNNLSTTHEFIKINKGCFTYSSRVLVFPTKEMRDAFYENFKGLIEQCKEFL